MDYKKLPYKFSKKIIVNSETNCWEWVGAKSSGYGTYFIPSDDNYKYIRRRRSHRFSYEFFIGPIPNGFVIDHLCRNRKCCNPEHLEAVTLQENSRRSGSIKKSDKLTAINMNTYEYTKDIDMCDNSHLIKGSNLILSMSAWGVVKMCVKCKEAPDKEKVDLSE